jgi:hypothetical protein
LMGASKEPGRTNLWRAGMNKRYLGMYRSPEEAHQAYLAAKAKYHLFQPTLRGG